MAVHTHRSFRLLVEGGVACERVNQLGVASVSPTTHVRSGSQAISGLLRISSKPIAAKPLGNRRKPLVADHDSLPRSQCPIRNGG